MHVALKFDVANQDIIRKSLDQLISFFPLSGVLKRKNSPIPLRIGGRKNRGNSVRYRQGRHPREAGYQKCQNGNYSGNEFHETDNSYSNTADRLRRTR